MFKRKFSSQVLLFANFFTVFTSCSNSLPVTQVQIIEEVVEEEIDDIGEVKLEKLSVDIETLIGTWIQKGFLYGGIKPSKSYSLRDEKLTFYFLNETCYLDYSYKLVSPDNTQFLFYTYRKLKLELNTGKGLPFFTLPTSQDKRYIRAVEREGKPIGLELLQEPIIGVTNRLILLYKEK